MDFSDKTAVITGAASGIGRALAKKAADLSMRLVLSDIDVEPLEGLKTEMVDNGIDVITVVTDVSDAKSVAKLAELAFDTFGTVDLLFNNAGVMVTGMTWAHTVKDWDWLMGVNFMGVVHGIQSFLPRMMAQGTPARIINTGSIAGLLPSPTTSMYSASKHAVVSLSETLKYEMDLAQSQVGVSVICPGPVATQIADGDRSRPEEDRVQGGTQAAAMKEELKKGIAAAGMPPSQLADIVFEKITAKQFWIFPHPEYVDQFAARAEGIVRQENPEFKSLVDFK